MTPSSPIASNRSSQSSASARSWVAGERRKRFALRSSSFRRSVSGFLQISSPFQTSTSKAMNSAGISAASLLTRLSAGCRRVCIASKSSTPSRRSRSRRRAPNAAAGARRAAAARGSSGAAAARSATTGAARRSCSRAARGTRPTSARTASRRGSGSSRTSSASIGGKGTAVSRSAGRSTGSLPLRRDRGRAMP